MWTAVVSLHILISLIIWKEPHDLQGCRLVPERKYLSLYNKASNLPVLKWNLWFLLKNTLDYHQNLKLQCEAQFCYEYIDSRYLEPKPLVTIKVVQEAT